MFCSNKSFCILIEISKQENGQKGSIDSGNGLVPNRWQAITSSIVDQDLWRHMVVPVGHTVPSTEKSHLINGFFMYKFTTSHCITDPLCRKTYLEKYR